MRTLAALLLLLATLAPQSWGKDMDGEFAVFSAGANRCSEYLRARQSGGRAQEQYAQWIQGYLSAFNLIVQNTYNILGERGFPKALAWLDEHCRENPEERFVNATAALTVNLFPLRTNLAPNKDTSGKWLGQAAPQPGAAGAPPAN